MLRRILLALPVLVLVACGTPTHQPTPLSPGTAISTARAARTAMPTTVQALIALPQTPFDVKFEWDAGLASGEKVALDWRQAGGVRRTDAQISSDTGSLYIESGFSKEVPLTMASTQIGCDWYRPPDAQDVHIACDTGPPLNLGFLPDALDSAMEVGTITRQIGSREIAGLHASCYDFSADMPGTICTDGAGVPLYFQGAPMPGEDIETITATHVSREVPPLVIPDGLPLHTKLIYKLGPLFPVSRLQLPDWNK